MELINKIAAIPLFTGLPLNQHENLAAIALQKTFKRGQTIFAEGDEGIGFYIILSGRVKIFKLSAEGKEQILHIMENQEPFGEAAVFAGEHYPASAQSIVETKVLLFPRQAFVDLISKNPSLALNMLAFLSRRLRMLCFSGGKSFLERSSGKIGRLPFILDDRSDRS